MDSFIVSARKYRPSTFKSVVGQSALTTTLKNAIKSNHLAHAYLFCGPRGVGKTTCARIFAKTINCQNPTADHEACNECESCKSFNEQRSYNIHELDAASNNSVDDIKTLMDQVRIPPQVGKYSVFIIDEVHMLSSAAFNAFLKTLEEPPSHAIFILATTEKHKIIPTILSRCQIYDFNRITISDTVNHLKYVASKEGVSIDESALNIIAQKSDGGMRDALSIFDQLVSFCGNNITYDKVIENLNVLDYEYYFRIVNRFLTGNINEALLIFNEILNKGFEAQHFITGLSTHLRNVMVSKDPATIQLLEVGSEIGEKYKQQAINCSVPFLFGALNISNECDLNYRVSKNKRLLVELALIKMCNLTHPIEINENASPQPEITLKPENTLEKKTENVTEKPTQTIQPEPTSNIVSEKKEEFIKPFEKIEETKRETTNPVVAENTGGKFQRPQSFSISKLNNLTSEEGSNSTSTSEIYANQPFTEEELKAKWSQFFSTETTDKVIIGYWSKKELKLDENFEIKIKVNNKFQEKELNQLQIIPYLQKELKNSKIRFNIELIPENEQTTYLTPEETYKKMVTTNPALDKLRKNLEMEID